MPAAAAVTQPSLLASDHHRPQYHFLPPANWMNDPNGPIYWRDRYHMFFQYNPNAPVWGNMHWGHAVSPDMIHWKHLPIALAPTPGGADKDGVFSGCIIDNNGVPTVLYTGTKPEVQCLATGSGGLHRFTKRKEPVIAAPPPDLKVTGFRDPCVWREQDTWYMALGSGFAGVGGAVLLYKSPDLLEWSYSGVLYQGKLDSKNAGQRGGPVATGEMYECPSFFALGEKHVLFVSTMGATPYWIGSYKDSKFEPESEGWLDHGAYYAPITQLDDRGHRILWGWIPERRSRDAQRSAGWSGVLSLPRVLNLRDGKLEIEPASQVRGLRRARQQFVNLVMPDNKSMPLPGVAGDSIEIVADIDFGDAEECGIHVLASPDGAESTPIVYHRGHRRLTAGPVHVSQNNNLTLSPGERLRLNIFIDASVIEIFANNRMCLTDRAYTSSPDCTNISLFARGGTAKMKSMQVFELKPISNDRLTT